jgi:hypothetical protein
MKYHLVTRETTTIQGTTHTTEVVNCSIGFYVKSLYLRRNKYNYSETYAILLWVEITKDEYDELEEVCG